LAGTSGGIACLGHSVPDFIEETRTVEWVPGLSLFSDVLVAAHWNSGRHEWICAPYRERSESTVVAVGEQTALVGDGSSWRVSGLGAASVIRGGHESSYLPDESVDLEAGVNVGG
jgi:cyanophycinase-like exopeptidase